MSVLKTDLSDVTVVIIDVAETAAKLEEAFTAAGATVFVVSDLESSPRLDPSFVPDVAVMDPGIIADRKLRALAFRLADDDRCVPIFYDTQWPEGHYGRNGMIHKSRPIAEVVDAAVLGMKGRIPERTKQDRKS
ncbi:MULTISPECIES: hypothetical protein [unclassified Sinorhizobium]|uniref:hypothetical protein n=1 Tax=unclassified Sinorhizobium TaxID=2613772 RepID=UPI0024C38C91|nr:MULTISPECIES: hypothetical protein [unclassified Sinorhizobium]MDK1376833.1 hypothetical protein [Sinorhizobium sp. 6-70]MDK1481066.1 hypothetical protein [Sinorhizobium sp. 6-117]